MQNKKIHIAFYSGTGGTLRVAVCLQKQLIDLGHQVTLENLSQQAPLGKMAVDLLFVLFPVHACNAPEAVYQWIDALGLVSHTSAVVISVSGGGEVIPNTASRIRTIKRLEKKGFSVIYEKMIVMPSNWIVATKKPLAQMLLDILPVKIQGMVTDIERGVTIRTKPIIVDRLFSLLGEFEKQGAKYFGKRIKVNANCNGCGWCVQHCPSGNITLEKDLPTFMDRCHLCLSCIYSCPRKALAPGTFKFITIKEGYDLKALEASPRPNEAIDVETLAKGYLWSGVKKYLMDNS